MMLEGRVGECIAGLSRGEAIEESSRAGIDVAERAVRIRERVIHVERDGSDLVMNTGAEDMVLLIARFGPGVGERKGQSARGVVGAVSTLWIDACDVATVFLETVKHVECGAERELMRQLDI